MQHSSAAAEAAKLAGLHPMAVLSRPVAVTIAHSLRGPCKTVVLHIGGETVSASLLQVNDSGSAEVLGSFECSGDAGGNALDQIMFELVESRRPRGPVAPEDRPEALVLCRQAKERLTQIGQVDVQLTSQSKDTAIPIKRLEFEELCVPVLQRAMTTVEALLHQLKYSRDDVDHCIVAGGTAKLPVVARVAETFFDGCPQVMTSIMAESVVAFGAASHASTLRHAGSTEAAAARLGKTDLYIDVESKGTEAGCSMFIKLDGVIALQSQGQKGMGFNVVIVHQLTGEVENAEVYDTRSNPRRSEDLERDISALPDGRIVIVAICGETRNLNQDANLVAECEARVVNTFRGCGCRNLATLGYRCSWAIIGIKGGSKSIVEQAGETASSTVELQHRLALVVDPQVCTAAIKEINRAEEPQTLVENAKILASAAQSSDAMRVDIVSNRGGTALLNAMNAHSTSKEVQVCCAAALSALTMSPANRITLVEAGAIKQLSSTLALCIEKMSMLGTFKNAAWGLARLVADSSSAAMVVVEGAMSHLVAGLNGYVYDEQAQEAALRALVRIVKSDTSGTVANAMNQEASSALKASMARHPEHRGIQSAGTSLIGALAAIKHDVAWGGGGAAAVKQAMEMHPHDVPLVRSGCMALAQLVRSTRDAAAQVSAGGVETVVAAIVEHSYSLDIVLAGMQVLVAVCETSGSHAVISGVEREGIFSALQQFTKEAEMVKLKQRLEELLST